MRRVDRVKLPWHPLLGRNVNHDSESRRYGVRPSSESLRAVRHRQSIEVLFQRIGACTGNAGVSCIYHFPFFMAGQPAWVYPPDEDGAESLYSAATRIDPYGGEWPPTDTGSDGLSIAKVLTGVGIIAGEVHAFTLESALLALVDRPWIMGVPWFNGMFDVPSSGLVSVDVSSGLAGGHELVADELVSASDPRNGTGQWLVGGDNSWGTSWGDGGRWYLKVSDFDVLRKADGDVTQFVPNTVPAPTPDPVVGPLGVWYGASKGWMHGRHVGGNASAARAARVYARAEGLE